MRNAAAAIEASMSERQRANMFEPESATAEPGRPNKNSKSKSKMHGYRTKTLTSCNKGSSMAVQKFLINNLSKRLIQPVFLGEKGNENPHLLIIK